MNTLTLKSCKHQNNIITFTKASDGVFVEGVGKDSWTQNDVHIKRSLLESVDIKILRGKGDNDIVITIETVQDSISAVLGSPGNSGDIHNSRDTYLFFNEIITGADSLNDSLMRILD